MLDPMGNSTLVQRIVSGVILIAVVVGCFWLPWGVPALACLMTVTISLEFYRLVSSSRFRKEQVLVVLAMLLAVVLTFLHLAYGVPFRWVVLSVLPLVATSMEWK